MPSPTPRWSWTQPQCEPCWDIANPDRHPSRLIAAEPETCVTCGEPTSSGIYIRTDPASAPYPTHLKDA